MTALLGDKCATTLVLPELGKCRFFFAAPRHIIDTAPSEFQAARRGQLTRWRSGGAPGLAQVAAEAKARLCAVLSYRSAYCATLPQGPPTMSRLLALISSSVFVLILAFNAGHGQTLAAPTASSWEAKALSSAGRPLAGVAIRRKDGLIKAEPLASSSSMCNPEKIDAALTEIDLIGKVAPIPS